MSFENVFYSKLDSFFKLSEDEDPRNRKCRNCGILDDRSAKKCKFHTSFFRVSIPKDHMGLVVGKEESGIKQIETASKVKVNFNWKNSEILIHGTKQEVGKAFGMIRGILKNRAAVEVNGSWDCCGGGNVKGCTTEKMGHNFQGKVFALDCEMVTTAKGREVARVALLNFAGDTCYESLVKPSSKIWNYRTKHSGITKDMLQGVKTTVFDVRQSLNSLISVDDILIGHSIDNDLRCLDLNHGKVGKEE